MKKTTGSSVLFPTLVLFLAGTAVILLWTALRKDLENRVADIVEAVSYAARSEMARQLIGQFRAFEQVQSFWSTYADIPIDQWESDAMIEIDHFAGLDVLAWVDRNGPRFLTSGSGIALNHVPTDEEWQVISDSIDDALSADTVTIVDPIIDGDGHAIIRFYLPATNRDAVMIAIVDATDQVAALLENESPGYDIRVSCCEDTPIYSTGEFAADVPGTWVHRGRIQPLNEMLWLVEHQPSAALASDFRPWALTTVLIVGLALALATGAIAYHSRRADERAAAARAAARQVRALNQQLEKRVKRRTRELREALSDLNTISLSVGHDVRSPLNSTGLTLDTLLARFADDHGTTAQLQRARSGVDQITNILDRLLALARVSAFDTEIRQVDFEELAGKIAAELTAGTTNRITVGHMPATPFDPTMADILLTNLLANAIRHSAEPGHARIEVGSRNDLDSVVYFVRDHGRGIAPALKKSLFEQGKRGNSDTGLGLGLAIVARVIARHHGTIWVEDTEGGGATICFRVAAEPL